MLHLVKPAAIPIFGQPKMRIACWTVLANYQRACFSFDEIFEDVEDGVKSLILTNRQLEHDFSRLKIHHLFNVKGQGLLITQLFYLITFVKCVGLAQWCPVRFLLVCL